MCREASTQPRGKMMTIILLWNLPNTQSWLFKVDRILLRFDHMMWLLCDKVCYSCDDHRYSSTIRWDCKCGMHV